jgi:peptide/nickel transport system substrate-binding protein
VVLIATACRAGNTKSVEGHGAAVATATTAPPATVAVRTGGTLVYAAEQEPAGFNINTNAAHSTATRDIMDQVWPSVFHVMPDFRVVLNKDFVVSANLTDQRPQTVVMKINPMASWSDGVPITADDFIYFWHQQRDPKHTTDNCTDPKCPSSGKLIDDYSDGTGYRNIASVSASDGGKTVTVVFSQPFADWKSLWSYIVPFHLAQKVGWNNGFDKFDPNVVISGGPFMLQSYNPTKDLTLVPNSHYWGIKPHLDSIIFHFISDPKQQVLALENKLVDFIYPQPQTDLVSAVEAISDVTSQVNFGLSFEHIDFNIKTTGLDDPVVRKAIATAIDRPQLVQLTVGQFSSKATVDNNRMFVNNQPQYKDTSGGLFNKGDVAMAKQMLEGDGYTLGSDGVYAKAGKRLSFRISTTAGNALRESTEALVQAQLKPAGIAIKIVNSESRDFFAKTLASHDFDLGLFAWVNTPFPSGNNSIYSQAPGPNYGQSGSPALDQTLIQGAGAIDPQKEADDYNAADTIIWQNMWTLPLFQTPTFIAVRDTFVNIRDNVSAEGPFWNAETWGQKP